MKLEIYGGFRLRSKKAILALALLITLSSGCPKKSDVTDGGGKIPLWKLRRDIEEGNKKEKLKAVRELAKYQNKAERAVSILRLALRSSDSDVRREAIKSLADLGVPGRSALIEVATSQEGELKELAFRELEGFGHSLPQILGQALSHPYWKIRLGALKLIAELKPPSESLLIKVAKLLEDPEVDVRVGAAKTLRELSITEENSKKVSFYISKALRANKEWWTVRLEILRTLQRWGKAGAESASAVVELLGDSDEKVQKEAAKTLEKMGTAALDALIQGMSSASWQVKVQAAQLLAKLGKNGAPAAEALEGALEDNDLEVRKATLKALIALGEGASRSVPAVLRIFKSDKTSPAVRKLAVLFLFSAGTEGQKALQQILTGDDWLTRKKLFDTIGQLGEKVGEKAVPFLRLALQHRETGVKIISTIVLRKLGPKAAPALPELVQALRDRDPTLRKMALRAIANLGLQAKNALPHLKKLLRDPDPDVREQAKKVVRELSEK